MKTTALYIFFLSFLFATPAIGQLEWHEVPFKYRGEKKEGVIEYHFWKDGELMKELTKYSGSDQIHDLKLEDGKQHIYLGLRLKEIEKKYRLVVSPNCIETTGSITFNQTEFYELKEGKVDEIVFKIEKNGLSKIVVGFDIVKKDSDKSIWNCDKGKFVFAFNTTGLIEDIDGDGIADEIDNCKYIKNKNQDDRDLDDVGDKCDNCPDRYNPKQEDSNNNDKGDACEPKEDNFEKNAQEKWNATNTKEIRELCSFYSEYSASKHGKEAKKNIRKLEKTTWDKTEKKNTISDYTTYLKYLNNCGLPLRYKKEAKSAILKIKLRKEWDTLKAERNKEKIIAFLKKNKNYQTEIIPFILEYFPSLEINKKEKNQDQWYSITVGDKVFHPRYKDISLDYGMKINDKQWLESGILLIEIKKRGNYKLLIQDSIGREEVLKFGYQFKAKTTDTSDSLRIHIEGGAPPYFINLIDKEGKEVWVSEYPDQNISLIKEDLIKKGIIGTHTIVVKHSYDNRDELQLNEKIILKKSISVQVISAIVLGFCVMVLAILLFIFLRKNKRKNKNLVYS